MTRVAERNEDYVGAAQVNFDRRRRVRELPQLDRGCKVWVNVPDKRWHYAATVVPRVSVRANRSPTVRGSFIIRNRRALTPRLSALAIGQVQLRRNANNVSYLADENAVRV
jgi:hypothetical protein